MRMLVVPMLSALLLTACAASKPETVVVTRVEPLAPPQALLQIPARPAVPDEPVSNADAAEYLLRLYEWGRGLEAQLRGISRWVEEARTIRAR